MLYRHQAPGKGARPGRCSGTAMTARATDCATVRLYDEAADLTCHQQTCFKVTGKSTEIPLVLVDTALVSTRVLLAELLQRVLGSGGLGVGRSRGELLNGVPGSGTAL